MRHVMRGRDTGPPPTPGSVRNVTAIYVEVIWTWNANPNEAGRIMDALEVDTGWKSEAIDGGRRFLVPDAEDTFAARDSAATALSRIDPGWQASIAFGDF